MNLFNNALDYIDNEINTMSVLNCNDIVDAFYLLLDTFNKEGTVYCIGNGGSASTASHFANDFNKGLAFYTSKKFHFNCLSDNIPTITAIANDISYDEIYRYQLKDILKPNDIILAISGSGNSDNIINAVKYARLCKNKIIGLTGFDGGRLIKLSDISLHVPIDNMQIVEDIHLMYDHLLMALFMSYFKENSRVKS